jgi:hypothetical protein
MIVPATAFISSIMYNCNNNYLTSDRCYRGAVEIKFTVELSVCREQRINARWAHKVHHQHNFIDKFGRFSRFDWNGVNIIVVIIIKYHNILVTTH